MVGDGISFPASPSRVSGGIAPGTPQVGGGVVGCGKTPTGGRTCKAPLLILWPSVLVSGTVTGRYKINGGSGSQREFRRRCGRGRLCGSINEW